jgi:hypothetical protein
MSEIIFRVKSRETELPQSRMKDAGQLLSKKNHEKCHPERSEVEGSAALPDAAQMGWWRVTSYNELSF